MEAVDVDKRIVIEMNDSELFSLAQLTGFDSTKEMYVQVLIMN